MATAKQIAWRKKFAERYGRKKAFKSTRSVENAKMARRRYRYTPRTVVRYVRGGYRRARSSGILGSTGSLARTVFAGAGAGQIGGSLAGRFGINPLIGAGLAGYLAGGTKGAIAAIAVPMVMNQFSLSGTKNVAEVAGQVWS